MGLFDWFGGKSAPPEWHVTAAHPQRFASFGPSAAEFLDREGYVVISALSSEEVEAARGMLWAYWEELDGGISRTNRESWGKMDAYMHANTGIVNSYGIGQSKLLWYLRSSEAVTSAFASIWGTEDLITSFDGGGMFRPWSVDPKWKTSGGWFHADQSLRRKGRVCVQGLVSLFDQTSATGGLTLVPGSHERHQELCRATWTGLSLSFWGHDFVPIPPEVWTRKGFAPQLVCCQAGDLILWDSRTVHCNSPALEDPPPPSQAHDFLRAVGYVCMTPRAWATEAALAKRRELVRTGQTSTHWPHEPYAPYNWPNNREPLQLSEAQQKLV
mmetsp:Transcript_34320/g.61246  ORF Transcript_34320/g.61246 Transcript_34320/m.61246 type:complete len:328 (-) Transcript_34320:300-1283(-)|eukprot:CAMPEP_0177795904 /NCGR_PEP_ID=MMETSP0491_2-20121128/26489_1 /TAXON_ID=63592 /ORGANISM="Tetraselmis chuii, Strain PLY429" /LENGTH=327 /DNA_ID=CAMNT_0019318781 /DNA_START=199 /DNA_END=1182 /DNA_ORIENTATION=-